MGFSGVTPVPAYSSGSSDRTVSGYPAFIACQAIAAGCTTGQPTSFQSIASTAYAAVNGTLCANRREAACLPAPTVWRSAATKDSDGMRTQPVHARLRYRGR